MYPGTVLEYLYVRTTSGRRVLVLVSYRWSVYVILKVNIFLYAYACTYADQTVNSKMVEVRGVTYAFVVRFIWADYVGMSKRPAKFL